MANKRTSITGLGSAILEETVDGSAVVENILSNDGRLLHVPIDQVKPNPDQPRKTFDEQEIEGLAQTIISKGVVQPLIVYEENGSLILVAGERRLRAAQKVGLKKVPVLFRGTKADALEISIIENVQRSNLHPLELADALRSLAEEKGYNQDQLAATIGKSKATISQILALTGLSKPVRAKVWTSKLASLDALYHVAKQPTTVEQLQLLDKIESGNLTVRETRQEVKKDKSDKGRPKNFSYTYKPPDKSFSVSVSFRKTKATRDDIKEALNEALKNIK